MLLFALSNFVLQVQRPKLPRDMQNNLLIPALAASLVVIALGGSIATNANVIPVFLLYWLVLLVLVSGFMCRLQALKTLQKLFALCRCCPHRLVQGCGLLAVRIQQDSSVVYFSKTANICRLNMALHYVIKNEDTNHVRIVHVYTEEDEIPQMLIPFCQILDTIYPRVKIDVILVQGRFGPAMITHLSRTWNVPSNLMFITCPTSSEAGRRLQDLRGVRVIMGHEEDAIPECEVSTLGTSTPVTERGAASIGPTDPQSPLLNAPDQQQIMRALLNKGLARELPAGTSPSRPRAQTAPSDMEASRLQLGSWSPSRPGLREGVK